MFNTNETELTEEEYDNVYEYCFMDHLGLYHLWSGYGWVNQKELAIHSLQLIRGYFIAKTFIYDELVPGDIKCIQTRICKAGHGSWIDCKNGKDYCGEIIIEGNSILFFHSPSALSKHYHSITIC